VADLCKRKSSSGRYDHWKWIAGLLLGRTREAQANSCF